jgi:hypothetical protein
LLPVLNEEGGQNIWPPKQTRPAIAQRRAAARPGRNDVELWILLAGRKVLDVAFFSSHTWHSGGGKHGKTEKKAGRIETTGEIRGQMEQVQLVDPRTRPIKEKSAKSTPDSSTVAGLFADPPGWLPTQLEKYRENPQLHFEPLCNTVAAVVLGDSLRGDEVRDEVERILEEGTRG